MAVGSTGCLRKGDVGHPLDAVFDTAVAVEEGSTGKWKVAGSVPHYASDGIHPSPVAYAAMAAVIPINVLTGVA